MIYDYADRQTPDYYTTMYMDGYKPYEILQSHRRYMEEQFIEDRTQPFKIAFNGEVR